MATAANIKTNIKSLNSSDPPEVRPEQIHRIIQEQVQPIKDELNNFKAKIIEVLAIFVALFTFVSVDVQIFKLGVSFLSATGTSLITLGALIFFISALHFVLNTENFLKNNKVLLIVSLISFSALILGGIYLIKIDYNDYTKHIRENFYTKQDVDKSINQNLENLESFKKCLKDGGWRICF